MTIQTSSFTQKARVPDVILVGAGIMSATLGMLLKELEPSIRITILERLDVAAAESSDAWNNAGTGHSAFCELNYTPEKKNGSIDISKAIQIAESFEVSKQFWSYLVRHGKVNLPDTFIRSIPHMSFVWGDKNVAYLRKRFEAMKNCHLFADMQYTEDRDLLESWIPLVMHGRKDDKVAATRMDIGTDVNFGALTRSMFDKLQEMDGVTMLFHQDVTDIEKNKKGRWEMDVKDHTTGKNTIFRSNFVFIGAGGGSLPLLEKCGIPESKGYGGFPVSGQWLRCTNEEIIEQHQAKVYGLAEVGSPPMSVPHLDTRFIDGKRALLFGPYAGFSTKFLKNGSFMDLPKSIKANNLRPMLSAGIHNIPLTKYLIDQVRQSPEDRLNALKKYMPKAEGQDWKLEAAGQRVQVIKKDKAKGGVLEFGTEVVTAADGSIAALLGASPGASTAVSIMIELMERCFKGRMDTEKWKGKLSEMIPSYGKQLSQDKNLYYKLRKESSETLGLFEVDEAAIES